MKAVVVDNGADERLVPQLNRRHGRIAEVRGAVGEQAVAAADCDCLVEVLHAPRCVRLEQPAERHGEEHAATAECYLAEQLERALTLRCGRDCRR